MSEADMVDLPCVCADEYSIGAYALAVAQSRKVTPSPEKLEKLPCVRRVRAYRLFKICLVFAVAA